MRLIPRSIAGQLLAVGLLAMLATHGIAVLIMSWWRADHSVIHPMSVRTIETRIAAAYRLVNAAGDGGRLLDSISLPDSTYRVDANPATAPAMNPAERKLARELRDMLDLPQGWLVQVQLRQIHAGDDAQDKRNWLEKTLSRSSVWELHAEVRLPDGRLLVSDHLPSIMPADWGQILSFSLLVGMIPTTLIAIFFGRRIMRPFKVLTRAAHKVSRGEQAIVSFQGGTDSVREIMHAFNNMQRSLLRFVNERTLMFAAIGHDLRTPLTSLRIRAELVEDEALRQAMIQTLDDMRVMVDEILTLARDDAMQEPTQEIGLNGFVQELVNDQCMRGREVAHTSLLPDEYTYRCRPVHLKRALNNLIDNAARYGAVAVNVRQDSARQLLEIEVLDNGPGIAPDQLEHVFEPFVRLDASRPQTVAGFGLGLTIAQSCVRAHGGAIVLENQPAGGLRAVIELPA